ncbi:MAG: hypothetical protein JJV98_01770 [Desulfosarcina sp.]|nr:hypothetical protein [Desulfobacterales bacterium]
MASWWHITAPYAQTSAGKVFHSLETAFACRGELITASPISRVKRVEIGPEAFYVKLYYAGGKHLRRWIGRSRARAEWENLKYFHHLGIPAAVLTAFGQETRLGLFKRAALITREIPDTRDLASLQNENHPLLRDRRWVNVVSRQIATHTRRLHRAGFVHVDLKWRNILVNLSGSPRIFLIDCPAGCHRGRLLAPRGFIKDLACLDKVAKRQLSRTQRLRFYLDYVQRRRLTADDKKRIQRILCFFYGRD